MGTWRKSQRPRLNSVIFRWFPQHFANSALRAAVNSYRAHLGLWDFPDLIGTVGTVSFLGEIVHGAWGWAGRSRARVAPGMISGRKWTRRLVPLISAAVVLTGFNALAPAASAASALKVTTMGLADATQGQAYSSQLTGSGGAGNVSWSMKSGVLPVGLGLTTSGALAGTPAATGSYSFVVEAQDSSTPTSQISDQALTLTVHPSAPLRIAAESSVSATQGEPFSSTATASGGVAPYQWTLTGTSPPSGVGLSADGTLSGTPTQSGTFTLTLHVSDSASPSPQIATQKVILTVAAGSTLAITTPAAPEATQGVYLNSWLAASGAVGAATWSLAAGNLPPGLTLAAGGELFGTPTTAGHFGFTVEVTDSATPIPQVSAVAMTMTVAPASALQIDPSSVPSAVEGNYVSRYLVATGGVAPYSWKLQSGSLPAGVTLSPAGRLSGTPSGNGIAAFTLAVTDSAGPVANVATAAVSMVVSPPQPLTTQTAALPDGTVGGAYYASVDASGGLTPYTWSIASGDLPPGLSLDPSNGSITGTPTAAGSSTFTLVLTDSRTSSIDIPLAIDIASAADLAIASPTLSDGEQGQYYDYAFTATGGVGAGTWSIVAGSLPPGLILSAGSGDLSGTPTGSGSFHFTVEVTDSASPTPNTVTVPVSVDVTAAPALTLPPEIFPSLTQGQFFYTYLDGAGGVGPYTYSTAGTLPPGLTLDASGYLSGTPRTAGDFPFTIKVSDSASPVGSDSQAVDITVDPETQPLTIQDPSLPAASHGESYDGRLVASGGVAPYSWTLASGSLPPGLSLDRDTGEVTGVPASAGTFSATFRATDSRLPSPETDVVAASIKVAEPSPQLLVGTAALPALTQGRSYPIYFNYNLRLQPYQPGTLSWSVISGALPEGMAMDDSGLIYGTPSRAGYFSFTVQVAYAQGIGPQSATKALSIMVKPSAVAVAADPIHIGQGQSSAAKMAATGGVAPYTWSLVSGSLPDGLALSPTGAITGTAGSPSTATVHVSVADSSTPQRQTATGAVTIVVEPVSPITITTKTLPAATAGQYYYEPSPFAATGGTAPYTWSASLPAGLSMDSYGGVSGYPTGSGDVNFGVTVTDSTQPTPQTATARIDQTIAPASPLTGSASLPAATVGQQYYGDVWGSGGVTPYTMAIVSGTLPDGLTLDQYGNIEGTPRTAGTSTFTIGVSDSATPTAAVVNVTRSIVVAAAAPLTFTSYLPAGTQGAGYDGSFDGQGGVAPYTFSLLSGALPDGLDLASDGSISGAPNQVGTFTFTVEATDSAGIPAVATRPVSITVAPADPLAISPPALPDPVQGQLYQANLYSQGGTGSEVWKIASGSLPAGLSLDYYSGSYARIAGIPTGTGTSSFTVSVSDGPQQLGATTSATLSLHVRPGTELAVVTTSLPAGSSGTYYQSTIDAVGGAGDYTWSVASGALPAGLSLSAYGTISGSPTATGTSAFTVAVTDHTTPKARTAIQSLSIKIGGGQSLAVTTTTLPPAVQGQPYDASLSATGGVAPYTWALASGTLPAGLSLDASSGEIYGQPTAAGTATFTVRVTDAATAIPTVSTAPLSLVTTPAAALAVSTTVPVARQGQSYSASLAATGGTSPYTWAITSGALPAGLSLQSDGDVSGMPTGTGSATVTVQASDSATPSAHAQAAITFTVLPAPALRITSAAPVNGTQGSYYSHHLMTSGGVGQTAWSIVSGALPSGLTLSQYGLITGTPTTAGSFTATAAVVDSATPTPAGLTTQLTISVHAAALQISGNAGAASVGKPYVASLYATGGTGSYVWSIGSGALPDGISLADGQLSGTPTTAGSFTFAVDVSDGQSADGVASTPVTIVVAAGKALAIDTASLPPATQGNSYYAALSAHGGIQPYAWAVTSGALPTGVSLDPGGWLTGVPRASGVSRFTIGLTDSSTPAVTTQRNLTLTVSAAAPLQIEPSSLAQSARQGKAIAGGPYAYGGVGPYTWNVVSGQLPAGVSLDPNGSLTGVPLAAGSSSAVVRVTDSALPQARSVDGTLKVTVAPADPLAVTTRAPDQAVAGQYYSFYLGADGRREPYTWSVTKGALPAGLSLDPAGFISGTPTGAGNSTFDVSVTDSNSPTATTVTKALSLKVLAANPLTINWTPGTVLQGQSFDSYLSAVGGIGPYTWTLSSGALPAGLTLSDFGEITGIPTGSGSSTFTVAVTDSAAPTPAVSTRLISLDVAAAGPLQIPTQALTDVTAGAFTYQQLTAQGGRQPYTWTLKSGALPAGLDLAADGSLSGTPIDPGPFTFIVTATDSSVPTPEASSGSITMTILPPAPLAVSTSQLFDATQGQAYFSSLNADGGDGPYTWSLVSGSLPSGLTLDADGRVSGVATKASDARFAVRVTDSAAPMPATATALLSLTVQAGSPLSVASVSLPDATAGQSYSDALTPDGGVAPYSWTLGLGFAPIRTHAGPEQVHLWNAHHRRSNLAHVAGHRLRRTVGSQHDGVADARRCPSRCPCDRLGSASVGDGRRPVRRAIAGDRGDRAFHVVAAIRLVARRAHARRQRRGERHTDGADHRGLHGARDRLGAADAARRISPGEPAGRRRRAAGDDHHRLAECNGRRVPVRRPPGHRRHRALYLDARVGLAAGRAHPGSVGCDLRHADTGRYHAAHPFGHGLWVAGASRGQSQPGADRRPGSRRDAFLPAVDCLPGPGLRRRAVGDRGSRSLQLDARVRLASGRSHPGQLDRHHHRDPDGGRRRSLHAARQ